MQRTVPIRNGSDATAVIQFTAAGADRRRPDDGRLDDTDLGRQPPGRRPPGRQTCCDRQSRFRIGDFDGPPAPIHGPDIELGDRHDTHAGGMYDDGWMHPTTPKPTGGTGSDEPDPSRTKIDREASEAGARDL